MAPSGALAASQLNQICFEPGEASGSRVRALFAQHGTVESVALIKDRETGQPRGFGSVEMPRTEAARAIQNLNGHDMDGRPLEVNEAQDKPRGGPVTGNVAGEPSRLHESHGSCRISNAME